MKINILIVVGLLVFASAQAASVKVIALFSNKAMLQVEGEQKILKVGESLKGVKLVAANGRYAEVEINSNVMRLTLNQSIQGNFKKPELSQVRIYPNNQGLYFTEGKINRSTVKFLVDTGATFVTMSAQVARRLNIDYRKGVQSHAQTASAIVPIWQIKLASVTVGGITVRNVDASIIEQTPLTEVLLGNSFLKHTTLQRSGSVLSLEKRF